MKDSLDSIDFAPDEFCAYVDGFNLYKGALERRPDLKWLDLVLFCSSLRPELRLRKIYYFTARVVERFQGDTSPSRQHRYLRVLANQGIEIVYGKFRKNDSWMRIQPRLTERSIEPNLPTHAGLTQVAMNSSNRRASPDVPRARVQKLEEKGSDVNLASYLLRDAYSGLSNALVISGDADLVMPVKFAVDFGVSVRTVVPNRNIQCSALRAVSSSLVQLHTNILLENQLNRSFITLKGVSITRPESWK